MKVWAGHYINSDDPENFSTLHIFASEKELVVALAEDASVDAADCETMEQLEAVMEEEDRGMYDGFNWEVKDL